METTIKKIFDSYCVKRTILPLKDMENHLEYNITKIEKVNTKYGSKIRCLLDNQYFVYLPELFLALTNDQMEYINVNNVQLVRHSDKLNIVFRTGNNGLYYENITPPLENNLLFYTENCQ